MAEADAGRDAVPTGAALRSRGLSLCPQRRQKAQQGESVPQEGSHSFPASATSCGSLKTQQTQHPPLT